MMPGGPRTLAVMIVALGGLALGAAAQEAQESKDKEQTGGPTEPQQEAPPTAAPAKDEPEDGRVPSQPTPEEIIRAFQRDRPVSQPIQPRSAEKPGRPAQGSPTLLRDGEFINSAAGRLTRTGGWWTFAFESDTPESPRPPMRLLPNQMLERVVRESQGSGESVVFVVSGEVTLFESENYLLVRKALRRRSTDNLEK